MTGTVTVEADFVSAILKQVVAGVAPTTSDRLPVVLHANPKFAKAQETQDVSVQIHAELP